MSDAYIGVPFINQVSPAFQKEDFTGASLSTISVGAANYTYSYELVTDVPGANTENLVVVLDNVIQEPDVAYLIHANSSGQPRILQFTSTVLSSASIYVTHRGIGSFEMKPPTGSVGADQLSANLVSFTNDVFAGDGSTVAFTLSETLQKSSSNYSISGSTLTFTSAPDASAEVEARHFGLRGIVRRAPDFMYDAFSGDGSTTAFALSTGGATTNSSFIFYNGICLKPSADYSISGTTLTLTFAPVSASEIMARYQL
jgi:hypothetical protein